MVKVDYFINEHKSILGFKISEGEEEVNYKNDYDDIGEFINHLNSKFAELENKHSPKTIEEYFNDWELLITELSEKEIELRNLKEKYDEKEFKIVYQSDIDFKELYGSTSEKVRKHHANKELQPIDDAINELELSISYIKRRLDYIKHLMMMQGTLLEYQMGTCDCDKV